MIEVPDVVLRRPESVGSVHGELGLVVQPFDGAVVDGHTEVVQDTALMASEHPRRPTQWQ